MYACGQGVEKDLIKAKELSSKACEKDQSCALRKAGLNYLIKMIF